VTHRFSNQSCPLNADPLNTCCDCDLGDRREALNLLAENGWAPANPDEIRTAELVSEVRALRLTTARGEVARVIRKARREFGGCMPRRHLNLGLQQWADNFLERARHGAL
jgi:hypothetical protein